jgi:hypothetical protein
VTGEREGKEGGRPAEGGERMKEEVEWKKGGGGKREAERAWRRKEGRGRKGERGRGRGREEEGGTNREALEVLVAGKRRRLDIQLDLIEN